MKFLYQVLGLLLVLNIYSPSDSQAANSFVDEVITVKNFSYQTLSSYHKLLFDTFLDDEIHAGQSVESTLTDKSSLRNKARVAEALLFRNRPGDTEQAAVILHWILANQYQDDQNKLYGIWKTSISNDQQDQNWREFIGCDLIIILHKYTDLLSPAMISDIRAGLIHAAKGAMVRNVSPEYTNISVMSAFLMEYVGTKFNLDYIKNSGLKKAQAIYDLYQQHHTWSEYNSPTYYGVTLIGLALWRTFATSTHMQAMGVELEQNIWHEVASVYNANLLNMPGPYFRGYGMDMKKYHAILGLWIAIAVDQEHLSPMPTGKGPKYGEMSNIVPILNLGVAISQRDLAQLKSFSRPYYIHRDVPNTYKGDSVKQVTMLAKKDWMMGGLSGSRRNWNQIKTGTIHWMTEQGDIAWLLVPGDGNTNVIVDKTTMTIHAADHAVNTLEVYVYAQPLHANSFEPSRWTLPGMQLKIKTALPHPKVMELSMQEAQKILAIAENVPSVYKAVFEVPVSRRGDKYLVKIKPKKNRL